MAIDTCVLCSCVQKNRYKFAVVKKISCHRNLTKYRDTVSMNLMGSFKPINAGGRFLHTFNFWVGTLTLKRMGGGSNWHIAFLKARYDVLDAARFVKPSCNFHFWCLWWVRKKKFGGPKEFFSKILHSKFFFRKF